MKYITRIDHKNTHTWWVRIGYGIKSKVQKSFPDMKLGGTVKALRVAKKWRDEKLKELQPAMEKEYGYDKNGQRHWGTGVHEQWQRKGNYEYLYIVATYYDSKAKIALHKMWSVNKWGYDHAMKLAKQWRKEKLAGKK